MMRVNLLRSFAMCILLVSAVSCAKNKAYLVSSANKNINISDDYGKADTEILKIIAPYKAELDGQMDEQIGTLTGKMDKEKPNSPLLNFMGDALLDIARKKYPQKNIDGAVMNYGGIRVNSMQKGDLTVRKIFELMPFDNTMVLVEMDSIMVRKLYDRIAEYGGWPMSHGMSFDLADDKAMNGLGNNLPIQSKNNWLFAIPNYIAEGGDNCTFLLDAPKEDTGLLIRDILIEYVRDVKQIIPDTTHRINVKG
ncbi:MAG: 5'-nucleotidase C-terminal domain-containing protein [Saprospiraceae bacterium]|jgi:2',3'-cyclic-nucleotide 2'-phosphodiesterase (5'-nucleotidase family)|nr:5'-nucleotidase C-terminal domain-containing protein [Saprospiraceae bacterium]MBK8632224.1 5'-nucleotidase C-terminal domain-containing protein [Saprospiraceae bacterium]HMS70376.1 5'-nucleotidase C-terminal domain-containing protein [Saprospiraceae bacterium]